MDHRISGVIKDKMKQSIEGLIKADSLLNEYKVHHVRRSL